MPHFRVDDALHSHPKAIEAGDEAIGMWSRAGSYCMAYGTDGFVPAWWVKAQHRGAAKAKRLVAAKLWHPGDLEGKPGFWFHEFLGPGRQDSKQQIEVDREKARQRQASWRLSQRDSTRDEHRDSGRSSGYTQPNPTQPFNPVVDSGGEVAKVIAREPRPHCPKHTENSNDPCPDCRRRREWDKAQEARQADDELDERRRLKEIRDNCPVCHGTSWIPNTEPAIKCTHQEAVHA